MHRQSLDEVIARIEREKRARPGGVVATDGDGTLWSGDVGDDFFHAFLERGKIQPVAHHAMIREAERHGVDAGGTAVDLARRIEAEYHAGRFPEDALYELMVWCFAGWKRADVAAFARDVVDRVGLASRVHREVKELLAWAARAGIDAFIVSASPFAVIEAAAAAVGIAEANVVAALPQFDEDGTMITAVERPIPYFAGKVTRLRAKIADRPVYAALGDNAFDLPMLEASAVPIAVRAKPKLRARAHELPALIEIEPLP